jgi:uncharacterized surface protein with fasciclin (FAS1) repeats
MQSIPHFISSNDADLGFTILQTRYVFDFWWGGGNKLVMKKMQTITQLAAATPDLSTLVSLLKATGLDAALNDPTKRFTVFAPSNEAFEDLQVRMNSVFTAVTDPKNRELLKKVLLYHVLGLEVHSSAITHSLNRVPTLEGMSVTVSRDANNFGHVDYALIIKADIQASNGVVHVIDRVLYPHNTGTHGWNI